jgi:hypothetical protein
VHSDLRVWHELGFDWVDVFDCIGVSLSPNVGIQLLDGLSRLFAGLLGPLHHHLFFQI